MLLFNQSAKGGLIKMARSFCSRRVCCPVGGTARRGYRTERLHPLPLLFHDLTYKIEHACYIYPFLKYLITFFCNTFFLLGILLVSFTLPVLFCCFVLFCSYCHTFSMSCVLYSWLFSIYYLLTYSKGAGGVSMRNHPPPPTPTTTQRSVVLKSYNYRAFL